MLIYHIDANKLLEKLSFGKKLAINGSYHLFFFLDCHTSGMCIYRKSHKLLSIELNLAI